MFKSLLKHVLFSMSCIIGCYATDTDQFNARIMKTHTYSQRESKFDEAQNNSEIEIKINTNMTKDDIVNAVSHKWLFSLDPSSGTLDLVCCHADGSKNPILDGKALQDYRVSSE